MPLRATLAFRGDRSGSGPKGLMHFRNLAQRSHMCVFWIRLYQEVKCARREGTGKKRCTDEALDLTIVNQARDNPFATTRDIRQKLKEKVHFFWVATRRV